MARETPSSSQEHRELSVPVSHKRIAAIINANDVNQPTPHYVGSLVRELKPGDYLYSRKFYSCIPTIQLHPQPGMPIRALHYLVNNRGIDERATKQLLTGREQLYTTLLFNDPGYAQRLQVPWYYEQRSRLVESALRLPLFGQDTTTTKFITLNRPVVFRSNSAFGFVLNEAGMSFWEGDNHHHFLECFAVFSIPELRAIAFTENSAER